MPSVDVVSPDGKRSLTATSLQLFNLLSGEGWTAKTGTAADARAKLTAATAALTRRPGSPRTASFAVAPTDAGTVLEINSASPVQVTVPIDAAGAFDPGTEMALVNRGTGRCTIWPAIRNFVTNPNGETAVTGWTGRSGTISQAATAGVGGSRAIRSTATSTANFGHFSPTFSLASMGLAPGDQISARAWLSPSAGDAYLTIRFQAGGTMLSFIDSPHTTAGPVTISNATIPAGTDGVLLVTSCSAAATGATLDLDQVMLTPFAAAPTAYADGATPGCAWSGTANLSDSSGPTLLTQGPTVPRGGLGTLRYFGGNAWGFHLAGIPDWVMLDADALAVDRDNGQQGIAAPTAARATGTTLALTANQAYYVRFVPSRPMTIVRVAFRVTTAAGTDIPVEVGIANASGTRLVTSGSTTGRLNSTGTKTVTITATVLTPGAVYYAFLASSGAATLSAVTFPADIYGTAAPQAEMLTAATAFPVPATPTTPATTDTGPAIWLRET